MPRKNKVEVICTICKETRMVTDRGEAPNFPPKYCVRCLCRKNNEDRYPSDREYKVNHPLYRVWASMKNRCVTDFSPVRKYYLDKGIEVCKEWAEDSAAFIAWGIENGYKRGLSIDRIDGDKGYYPENCRWATPSQQTRNRKVTILTEEDAALIKAFRKHGLTYASLGRSFGVVDKAIQEIIKGRNWKDVPPADYLCIPI